MKELHVESSSKNVKCGTQTLRRGLDVLEAVGGGTVSLLQLSSKLGLTRSTTHRIAMALIERRYLKFVPREGYSLGPKLLQLGALASTAMDIVQLSRPHLRQLSQLSNEAVFLASLEENNVLFLDKIGGNRPGGAMARAGECQSLAFGALGKALLINSPVERWRQAFRHEASRGHLEMPDMSDWLSSMADCHRRGYAFDAEMGQPFRCVAAPILSADGKVVAAAGIAGASRSIDELRMRRLANNVRSAAASISRELGWCDTVEAVDLASALEA